MRILIVGVGALGSNLTNLLAGDLDFKEHDITILDYQKVEERNVRAGTQFYLRDQIGIPKVQALQYNVFNWYKKKIKTINKKLTKEYPNSWNILPVEARLHNPDLIVDCLDNHEARKAISDYCQGESGSPNLLHIGFSDQFTFAIEWEEYNNYDVPTDITSGFDICEHPGAGSFVKMVSSLASLVIQEFINNNNRIQMVGNKFKNQIIR